MYELKENQHNFDIFEKTSNFTLTTNLDKSSTLKILQLLNNGSGFGGFTPEFFTKQFSVVYTI